MGRIVDAVTAVADLELKFPELRDDIVAYREVMGRDFEGAPYILATALMERIGEKLRHEPDIALDPFVRKAADFIEEMLQQGTSSIRDCFKIEFTEFFRESPELLVRIGDQLGVNTAALLKS